MRVRPRVGVLGGTFDPIHNGHLAVAQAAQRVLDLDHVRFIPSARPPHRTDSPHASEYHRMEMIRRAIPAVAGWEVSDLELRRSGPSYTIDTLETLGREGFAPQQLFFLIGADAFAEIETWHRYPDVLDAAHFALVPRDGVPFETLRETLPQLGSRMIDASDLARATTPKIILIESPTPHISSTDIRRRARYGESLADLVPTAVAAYIAEHHLYRGNSDALLAPAAPLAPGE